MDLHWAVYWAAEIRRLADRVERQGKLPVEVEDDLAVAWIEERLNEPSVRHVLSLYHEYLGTLGLVTEEPR